MKPPQRIVLVGRRRLALRAARRLGLETLLLSEKAPGRADRELVVRHFDLPPVDAALAGAERLAAQLAPLRPEAVVATAEGTVRVAAALREALGLEGTSRRTATLCSNKLEMKRAVAAAGIPCARFAAAGTTRDELLDRLGLPLVIKPTIGWGGRGARRVEREAEVPARLPEGFLAERFVHGVEMSFEAILAGGRRLFSNPTEYLDPGWANLVPRPLAPDERRAVEALADRAVAALGVERGMIHLELFLTPDGPVFGEMAARPPGGHILRLMELAYDFDPWSAWLTAERGGRPTTPARAERSAAVRLLYPGGGRVTRVGGVEAAARVDGVVEATVRVRPGQELPPRVGVGQEAGRIVVVAADRAGAVAALEAARRAITIEIEPS